MGRIIPGLEVKIADNQEILLRGKTITDGYYKKPVSTAEAFTSDGWFRTGDAGYLKDGHLYLTGRIKELFKTSNGKYISPDDLLRHPKILSLFQARIETLQQQFAHYEQVKRFVLLPRPFSMEQGELTNTLKLRRAVVAEHFKDVIDKIYADAEQHAQEKV